MVTVLNVKTGAVLAAGPTMCLGVQSVADVIARVFEPIQELGGARAEYAVELDCCLFSAALARDLCARGIPHVRQQSPEGVETALRAIRDLLSIFATKPLHWQPDLSDLAAEVRAWAATYRRAPEDSSE